MQIQIYVYLTTIWETGVWKRKRQRLVILEGSSAQDAATAARFNRNPSELGSLGAPPILALRSAVQVLQFSDGKYPAEAQRNEVPLRSVGDFQIWSWRLKVGPQRPRRILVPGKGDFGVDHIFIDFNYYFSYSRFIFYNMRFLKPVFRCIITG